MPIATDVMPNEETGGNHTVVRVAGMGRHEFIAANALLQGANSVARNNIQNDSNIYAMYQHTEAAVRQITDNPELNKAFQDY